MTTTTVDVLEIFDDEPGTPRYGLEMMSLTGLPRGTVPPILVRFERLGWLETGGRTPTTHERQVAVRGTTTA